jgi:zinc D-Ala-D-Ala dipeptidase
MNSTQKIIGIIVMIFSTHAYAEDFSTSKQLITVISSDWNTPSALLQRYERKDAHSAWTVMGEPIPATIGKNGMAPGVGLSSALEKASKKEGDGRTPAGVFYLGPAFGFQSTADLKIEYITLDHNSVCIDDPNSAYYNRIINQSEVHFPDWQSSEKMRAVPLYQWGMVVQYNPESVKKAGSCIFMHIWRNPNSGTAGCIAMEEIELTRLLQWLDKTKKPIIAIYPQQESKVYEKKLKFHSRLR